MEDEKEGRTPEEEQVQSESLSEADADSIFNEAIGEAASADESGTTETPEKKTAEPPVVDEKAEEGGGATKDEDEPEVLKKRLQDTQRWGHELSHELASLKKQIEEMKTASDQAAKEKAEEVPEEVKAFYEDFPAFANAVQYEAKRLFKETIGDVDVKKLNEMIQFSEGQREFESRVVHGVYDEQGKFIEGHADAYRVMASPDFKSWSDEQQKANPEIFNVTDPAKAIGIISQFKEHAAKAGAKKHDEERKAEADNVRQFASGGIPQGTRASGRSKSPDEDDPEKLFNIAAGVKG